MNINKRVTNGLAADNETLTCVLGDALKRYVIDYHRLGAPLGVHGEQNQSVGAARLDVVQDERYRWSLQIGFEIGKVSKFILKFDKWIFMNKFI